MTLSGVEPSDYPDEESIRELLSGNICRCTGYVGIVDAVKEAWGRI
jgi:carbon-monoxide dehydrogenase small subunit